MRDIVWAGMFALAVPVPVEVWRTFSQSYSVFRIGPFGAKGRFGFTMAW